ncbi:DUF1740 domain-containing protein [Histoplasma capsulatum G186AR]|uniref:DUF1740 domain-containing protein n=1 Tax=Ajellomyces capsulatus TaxID=5037 RepID=A0A8H8D799_AJECA|nr:DUF1740 domain-containing protein [Histoplasma capsulatum]QSS69019.1 DUF1740 domain-containing protein [Histoplasma capsulatum G186AR]
MDLGDPKKPIPKFASFRPPSSTASADVSSEHEKGGASRKHERYIHESRHSRFRGYSHSRSGELDRHREPHSRDSRRVKPKPDKLDEQDFFIIDKKGDKYNVAYGSLNRYSIPKYFRSGSGRVIGLPPSYTIDRNNEDENTVVIRHNTASYDSPSQRNRDFLRKQPRRETTFRVRPDPENNPFIDAQKDFLPLASDGSRKRRSFHGEMISRESTPEDSTIDYRSIEGKAKVPKELSGGAVIASDSDIASDDESARRRNAELSRRVTERPDDIESWLQLIEHQGSLVGIATSNGQRRLTTAEKRSVADIKISMYEKALSKLPPKAHRDRLLLGMMEEATTLYDTKTLSNKWKGILKENPDYINLWIKYLDFQQTRFFNFTYEQCRSIFIDCLKLNASRKSSSELNVISIYLMLRLSCFMREAGYVEHAVGLWQAALEFNFYHPASLDISRDVKAALPAFCEFWDSEIPRIGEIGAKGWGGGENVSPNPKSNGPSWEIDQKSIFESWEQSERCKMRYSRLPARTSDDVEEDDPYRVILSSDITDFLISYSDVPDLLIGAFMIFCGLPPLASSGNEDVLNQWRRDPFVRNNLLDDFDSQSPTWFSDVVHGPQDPIHSQLNTFPLPTFANSSDTLFDNGTWFSELRVWKITYLNGHSPLDGEWVRRTLRHLVNRFPERDDLAEFTVALEFISNASDAKKYAKNLLKKRSSSLRLYNAYALMEIRSGRITAAEHVWTTALSMSDSLKKEDKVDSILLWRTWAWEILTDLKNDKTVRLLLAIPTGTINSTTLADDSKSSTSIRPAEFLKAQMYLTETQEHGLTSRKPNVFVSAVECLGLLVYLTRNLDIDAAINVYATGHSRLVAHRLENTLFGELLLQAKAKLLYHHATSSRIYKPVLLRSEITDSISHFPQNTLFLSLFAWNESRFRIDDRVRSVLRQYTTPKTCNGNDKFLQTCFSTSSTLIPHLFSIFTELHRGVSSGSTVHSARAVFESAVTSPSGQSSASTWKLYILFELTLSQWGRAREVFYRAIRSCPWAKELVLLAFRERGLRELMGQDELRKVWNVLVEKELRIHVDLEEWFNDWGKGRGELDFTRDLPIHMPEDLSSSDEGPS